MRTLYLLLACWLVTTVALAQAPLPASPPGLAAQLAPETDTVAAIHRLFAAKRRGNNHFVIGTLGVAAIGGVVIGTAPSGWNGWEQAGVGVALIAFVSLPALVVEAVKAVDYNKKNERRAVEDFQAHQLPRYLKRKLKPSYFQEPPRLAPSGR